MLSAFFRLCQLCRYKTKLCFSTFSFWRFLCFKFAEKQKLNATNIYIYIYIYIYIHNYIIIIINIMYIYTYIIYIFIYICIYIYIYYIHIIYIYIYIYNIYIDIYNIYERAVFVLVLSSYFHHILVKLSNLICFPNRLKLR